MTHQIRKKILFHQLVVLSANYVTIYLRLSSAHTRDIFASVEICF